MILYRFFRVLKVIGIVAVTSMAALILLPFLYLAGVFVYLSFTDKTDWHIEDYMCTIPQGCDEFIAERRRKREQHLAKPANPN